MFEEQFESARDEWKTFLEELKKHRNRKQYSVVWNADDPKKRIVITGFGSDLNLSGWTPSCGMVIPLKQLDEYTAEITERVPCAPDESEKPAAAQKTEKSAKPVPQKKNAVSKKETGSVKPAGREEGKP